MATRQRKPKPAFKLSKTQADEENGDLKKVKEQVLKELADNEKNAKDWYDKELDKNLKQQ